jgi:hypothetical protein
MASQYFIQREDQETGPFGFKELVVFVRDGKLVHSDRVRFSWTTEWQRADSLVGLFHMAQKAPELLTPPADLRPPLANEPIPAEQEGQVTIPEIVERPGWVMRLMQVSGFRSKRPAEIPILGPASATPSETSPLDAPHVGSDEPASSRAGARIPNEGQPAEIAAFFNQDAPAESNLWSSTIEAALAGADARARSGKRHGRWRTLYNRVGRRIHRIADSKSPVRVGLRLVLAIVCATSVSLGVESWSSQEVSRVDRRTFLHERQIAAGIRERPETQSDRSAESVANRLRHRFPLVGECDGGTYLFLIFDLALATGAAVYFVASRVESRGHGWSAQ